MTDVDDSQPAGSADHGAPAQHPAGSADAYYSQRSGWKRPLKDSESDNENENGKIINGIDEAMILNHRSSRMLRTRNRLRRQRHFRRLLLLDDLL